MAEYSILHSPRLSGEASVGVSKNAALPILAAALMTREEVFLHHLPVFQSCYNA